MDGIIVVEIVGIISKTVIVSVFIYCICKWMAGGWDND